MFERRIKTVLVLLAMALIVLVIRLIDLQIIHADEYREQAADALLLGPQDIPFARGRIMDRSGLVLASDEPSWDIKLDYGILGYGILDEDPDNLAAWVDRFGRSKQYGPDLTEADIERALRREIDEMWRKLAHFSGDSVLTLRHRAGEITERVRRIREAVAARRGFDAPVAEERMAHAIVTGLDDQQQIAARSEFGEYSWVKVEAVTHRLYHDAVCLAHVLGQTGAVDAQQMDNDPYADDELRCYQGDETVGVSGVECAAENLLRGRRGRVQEDRTGTTLENVEPQRGQDVHLTIRYDLQRRLYDVMGSALPRLPHSPGGAIVVLNVPTREVLALVSYPAYDPNRLHEPELYDRLVRDMVATPLLFRAVANRYPPGSLVKPLTCLAGLSSGRIDLDTRLECTGYLFPDKPEAGASKCWQIAGTNERKAHGLINVTEAIEGSCNVFMYRVGMALGVDALCNFFYSAGLGQLSGTGLREEKRGVNPSSSWLNEVAGRPVYPADARLFAIGQGELSATPVQAANMMATCASGTYRKVNLVRELSDDLAWQLPVSEAHLAAVHQGLFAVVNSPQGTAYKYARFVDDRYALCGKTGSATTQPRPVAYKVPYADADGRETFTILPAGSRQEAINVFTARHPEATLDPQHVVVHRRYPDQPPAEGGDHADAWFAGYLQRIDPTGQPMYEVEPRIAFAVLVEFGGSGGRTSGPIAQQVAGIIIDTLGDDLDADAPIATPPETSPRPVAGALRGLDAAAAKPPETSP